MSQLTNAGENLVADFLRGQGTSTWAGYFEIALATAVSDTSITEVTGSGYARSFAYRDLTSWAGTQNAGTVLASNGSSHKTSNNGTVTFPTATGSWSGPITHLVLYNDSNIALAYFPLPSALTVTTGQTPTFPAGSISFSFGFAGGVSNYFSNLIIDRLWRGVLTAMPANGYFALFTAAPTDAGGGTEVSGGGYARQPLPFSMLGFSGTQGAGTTVASSGSGGVISNNLALVFPPATADQGTIGYEGVFDAISGGNLLFWNALDVPRSVLAGSSSQTHAVSSWSITVA